MLPMKRLLPLLLLAFFALSIAATPARAYSRNEWSKPGQLLHQLDARIERVYAWRDRFGAGPRLAEEVGNLRFGIGDLTNRVQNRLGDPTVARKKAENLLDLMATVEEEFRERARHRGVVIEIYH